MWAIYWQDIEVKHGKRIGTEQKIQGPNSAVLLQLFLLQFTRTKGGGGPLPLTNHSLSDLGFFFWPIMLIFSLTGLVSPTKQLWGGGI